MKKLIQSVFYEVTTLNQASAKLISLFGTIKSDGNVGRIGYVAGIINSEGLEFAERNHKRLAYYTRFLRKQHRFPIFSSPDIFTDNVYKRLQEMQMPFIEREQKFYIFWRSLLSSGHITDIFMTPHWKVSKGAVDEHETAKKKGLKIHYLANLL